MKKPELRVVELGSRRVYEIFAIEEAVMQRAGDGLAPATLLLWYCSQPSISLGRDTSLGMVRPEQTDGYDLVRRISNGHALVHDVRDPSFSFIGGASLFSSPLELYRTISMYSVNALKSLGIQAESKKIERTKNGAKVTYYDTFIGEKKVAPTAQARAHGAFLQHGIFLYEPDFSGMNRVLNTTVDLSLLGTGIRFHSDAQGRDMHYAFRAAFKGDYKDMEGAITDEEEVLSRKLAPKYREIGEGKKLKDCLSTHYEN